MAKVRLFVDAPLGEGQPVPLTREQGHYLFAVMRLAPGDAVTVFDGRSGEWTAEVVEAGRRGGALRCGARLAPLVPPPDLWLMFAPLKKARTDFVVEKAVEMGAARVLPVLTAFTNAERVRAERLRAHAVEAAEQCGARYVPEVAEPERLDRLLTEWPGSRRLLWADESRAEGPAPPIAAPPPAAILIGPEGGFSEAERARLHAAPFAIAIRLGPRILRAETAAVAALALWQQAAGDWG